MSSTTESRPPVRGRRLTIRAGEAEARLLRQGAEAAGRSLNAFVVEAACAAACGALAGRLDVAPEEADWAHALALLGHGDAELPAWKELLGAPA